MCGFSECESPKCCGDTVWIFGERKDDTAETSAKEQAELENSRSDQRFWRDQYRLGPDRACEAVQQDRAALERLVCCSVLSDLKDTVWNLLQENDRTFEYDYLVIETSGVTDPRKVVETLDASFGKMYRARLDNVVCVVDCESWSDDSVASQNQIRSADTIVLNKIDLIAGKGGKVGEGEAWQRRMNGRRNASASTPAARRQNIARELW